MKIVVDRPVPGGTRAAAGLPGRGAREAGSDQVAMIGDLLLILDPACLLAAAAIVGLLTRPWSAAAGIAVGAGLWPTALAASVLGTLLLRDRRFGGLARSGRWAPLFRSHLLRWGLLGGILLLLGLAIPAETPQTPHAIAIWLISGVLATSLARLILARAIQRSQRGGELREVVAVVGAGPAADRLAQSLRSRDSHAVELLGIFDERSGRHGAGQSPVGTVVELIELGKSRRIDWIVVALPPTAEGRLGVLVHSLKALSAPIGLCLAQTEQFQDRRGAGQSGEPGPERSGSRWHALVAAADDCAPRWMVSLTLVPLGHLALYTARRADLVRWPGAGSAPALTLQFDAYDTGEFAGLAAGFGAEAFAYAVTPNTDHLIRLQEDPNFRSSYARADYILLDSRFLSHLMRLTHGLQLPVCTGSDLTAQLFDEVIRPDDRLVVIGCSSEQIGLLAERYGLRQVAHFNPPMGFIRIPEAVEACLRFVELNSPFRFCLLAVGAPQQEALAQLLKARGSARGMALCVGAALNFLTGNERRAPRWMQGLGLEWLFRLLQAPRRLAHRYLVRGPRVFAILKRARIELRRRPEAVARLPRGQATLLAAPSSAPPRIASGGPGAA